MKKMFKNNSHTIGPLSSKGNVQAKRYGTPIPQTSRQQRQTTRPQNRQGVTNETRI